MIRMTSCERRSEVSYLTSWMSRSGTAPDGWDVSPIECNRNCENSQAEAHQLRWSRARCCAFRGLIQQVKETSRFNDRYTVTIVNTATCSMGILWHPRTPKNHILWLYSTLNQASACPLAPSITNSTGVRFQLHYIISQQERSWASPSNSVEGKGILMSKHEAQTIHLP